MGGIQLPRKQVFFLGARSPKRNRAQSTLEYSVVIFCMVAALVAMQVYIKRAMQGKLKSTADSISQQQYAPKNTVTTTAITTTYSGTTKTNVRTFSEKECSDNTDGSFTGYNCDVDGDGSIESDVFATEALSYIDDDNPEKITEKGEEKVGEMESSLF